MNTKTAGREAGLCASCAHTQVVESSRGVVYYRCRRSDVDPRFPKYPTLPVQACAGYAPRRENNPDGATRPS
jgi:hypothetical protein